MASELLKVLVQKSQGRFQRIRSLKGPEVAVGKFFLLVNVTALTQTLYLPISIASGKKATGFVYQIEGTGEATIATTDISCSGEGVTQIRLGTLVYAKIPAGKTAVFHIQVDMKGKLGKEYQIIVSKINYKLNPADARYQVFPSAIQTKTVKFYS